MQAYLPHYHIPHQGGIFVVINGSVLTQNHPEPIVNVRIHSWCCMLLYNYMYPTLWYQTE